MCTQKTNTLSASTVATANSPIALQRAPARQSSVVKIARIHAGAAQQHRAVGGQHALEHSFDIVIAIRSRPARLRGHHGVGGCGAVSSAGSGTATPNGAPRVERHQGFVINF